MPRSVVVPVQLRAAPFSAEQVRDLVTRRGLQSRAYTRLGRGAYWVSEGEVDFGRRLQAFSSVLPDDAVLCGLAACWAHGVRHARLSDDVVVNVLPVGSARSRAGLRVRAQRLADDELVGTAFGRATAPARTVADLLRELPRARAVGTADELLRVTGAEPADVADALARAGSGRGVRAARGLLPLLDPLAESPRESLLRLRLVDAGLPAPVSQHEVRDAAGGFVARLDLAWPSHRVAVEYDGAHHREAGQHSRDLARHNRLRAQGWVVLQVDAGVLARPAALVAQLRSLLGA